MNPLDPLTPPDKKKSFKFFKKFSNLFSTEKKIFLDESYSWIILEYFSFNPLHSLKPFVKYFCFSCIETIVTIIKRSSKLYLALSKCPGP